MRANEWLALAPDGQRRRLAALLSTAARSREEQAQQMMASPPWPVDADDATARVQTIISYLMEANQ